MHACLQNINSTLNRCAKCECVLFFNCPLCLCHMHHECSHLMDVFQSRDKNAHTAKNNAQCLLSFQNILEMIKCVQMCAHYFSCLYAYTFKKAATVSRMPASNGRVSIAWRSGCTTTKCLLATLKTKRSTEKHKQNTT